MLGNRPDRDNSGNPRPGSPGASPPPKRRSRREFFYAYDGGRRSRKDHINNIWTWFPCGVACSAGELVEDTSDLTGQTWTTSALYLKGSDIVRRGSEYNHFDSLGTARVITDGSANVLSSNLYD